MVNSRRKWLWFALAAYVTAHDMPVRAGGIAFRQCDSLETDQFAKIIFGTVPGACTALTVSPHWNGFPDRSYLLYRVQNQQLNSFVDAPFEAASIPWLDNSESVVAVLYRSVDSIGYFDPYQFIAPTWYSGNFLAFVNPSLGRVLATIPIESSMIAGMPTSCGVNITALEWIKSVGDVRHLLDLVVDASNVANASGASREAFWSWDGARLCFLTSIARSDYEPHGWVSLSRTGRRFQDVDGDGRAELVLKRENGLGAGTGTSCSDSGAVVWRLRAIVPQTDCTAELVPTDILTGESTLTPIRSGSSYLVYPRWNVAESLAEVNVDTFRIKAMDEFASSVVQTTHSGVDQTNNDWRYSEAGAWVHAWVTEDSLFVEAMILDSVVLASRMRQPIAPLYDLALWFDPKPVATQDGSMSLDSCLLAIVSTDGQTDSAATFVYRVDERLEGCRYSMQSARVGRFQRLKGVPAYQYHSAFSRAEVGLISSGAVPALCGFAVEVFEHGAAPCQSRLVGLTQSERRFSRDDPSTWSTLIVGVRQDFVDRRQR